MNFKDYQNRARDTWFVPQTKLEYGLLYPALGLGSEAGEVLGKIKKIIRDHDGILTNQMLDNLKNELGDVLWYLTILADYLELDLEEIAEQNISKLADRKARGVIAGSGDNR